MRKNLKRDQQDSSEEQALVSIVTPSYNQGRFIEDTILSLKNQDYPNIEHIIVDGGSTDNTLEILRKYEGTYNMRWISEPDKGQSDAINKGLRMANGELLAYLNSDDTYCDGTITKIVNFFSVHPEIYLIYGDYIVIDAQDNVIKYKKEIEFDYDVLLYGFSYIPQPTVFFKRDILTNIGLFDAKLNCAMDCDYWIRVAREYRIQHLPVYLANFRVHRFSKTWNKAPLFREEALFLRKKYTKRYPKSQRIIVLYFKLLNIIYRIKRIYLKLVQGCYWR